LSCVKSAVRIRRQPFPAENGGRNDAVCIRQKPLEGGTK
jgi:hypothetical protein